MAVFTQSFVPNMTSAQYDASISEIKPLLQDFNGWLGFHTAAVVDGGMLISEVWETEALYTKWIDTVISTKIPADAAKAMKTTFVPLHNLVVTPALATA